MTCPTTVVLGSVIKFQCLNSPSPCEVSISVNNRDVAKSEQIATYTVTTNQTSYSKHNFTFSYSVCGGPVYSAPCFLNIAPTTENVPACSTTMIPVCVPASSTTTIPGMLLKSLYFGFVIPCLYIFSPKLALSF